ncbi:putative GNAT family N-acetyltransferase [Gonapodya prolifera JEL478]|uniref:Putative GNAT family N-acetyltransferase n=1 Tax=Gonapodya prolifera (strain JEL478) TaxID=1344416 RepID=A0A139AZT8_GONPJ|nr:putative GNAT family N-acetyltransferase [Gonapodya prolifera JEL478]|eukprot:KXS22256.1 putative GNAT family N-acetyltransferase [Gonapodya prolifera JEL478]
MPSDPLTEGSFAVCPARTDADLDATRALFRTYAAILPMKLDYQDFEGELASLPAKYQHPDGDLFLARAGDAQTPVGCVALRRLGEDVCELKRLYVDPTARAKGLGRALVGEALQCARRLGFKVMRLDTLVDMTLARKMYESMGFYEIAPYYETPVAHITVFLEKLL